MGPCCAAVWVSLAENCCNQASIRSLLRATAGCRSSPAHGHLVPITFAAEAHTFASAGKPVQKSSAQHYRNQGSTHKASVSYILLSPGSRPMLSWSELAVPVSTHFSIPQVHTTCTPAMTSYTLTNTPKHMQECIYRTAMVTKGQHELHRFGDLRSCKCPCRRCPHEPRSGNQATDPGATDPGPTDPALCIHSGGCACAGAGWCRVYKPWCSHDAGLPSKPSPTRAHSPGRHWNCRRNQLQ